MSAKKTVAGKNTKAKNRNGPEEQTMLLNIFYLTVYKQILCLYNICINRFDCRFWRRRRREWIHRLFCSACGRSYKPPLPTGKALKTLEHMADDGQINGEFLRMFE